MTTSRMIVALVASMLVGCASCESRSVTYENWLLTSTVSLPVNRAWTSGEGVLLIESGHEACYLVADRNGAIVDCGQDRTVISGSTVSLGLYGGGCERLPEEVPCRNLPLEDQSPHSWHSVGDCLVALFDEGSADLLCDTRRETIVLSNQELRSAAAMGDSLAYLTRAGDELHLVGTDLSQHTQPIFGSTLTAGRIWTRVGRPHSLLFLSDERQWSLAHSPSIVSQSNDMVGLIRYLNRNEEIAEVYQIGDTVPVWQSGSNIWPVMLGVGHGYVLVQDGRSGDLQMTNIFTGNTERVFRPPGRHLAEEIRLVHDLSSVHILSATIIVGIQSGKIFVLTRRYRE